MEKELIESCESLFNQDVLNKTQLDNCRKIASEQTLNNNEDKNTFEKQIFNENRSNKNKKIDDFFKNIILIQNNYSKLNSEDRDYLNKIFKRRSFF